VDAGTYGLMIFRCDGWRGRACMDPSVVRPPIPRRPVPRTRIRAIYFVTDTATWGVSTPSLAGAAQRVRDQLQVSERVRLLQFPGCPAGAARKTLVLLGPTFSGALDSVGQHL